MYDIYVAAGGPSALLGPIAVVLRRKKIAKILWSASP